MKTIKEYSGVISLLILLYLIFTGYDKTGDNIVTIGPLAEIRETGTVFKIVYNDTIRYQVSKTTGTTKLGKDNSGGMLSIAHPSGQVTLGSVDGTPTGNFLADIGYFEEGANIGTLTSGTSMLNVTGDILVSDSINVAKWIYMTKHSANPTPTAGSHAVIYIKGDKFIVAYNHGGTAKYRYIDLTGTDATWTYTTTPP
jgi:hypothetical protein